MIESYKSLFIMAIENHIDISSNYDKEILYLNIVLLVLLIFSIF